MTDRPRRIPMRDDNFVATSEDEPSWDEVVALDPEDAAVIQVDPDVDDFALLGTEFAETLEEEEADESNAEEDPDFEDDAEMSLLHDLGIDLDAPDGLPVGGFDLQLVMGSEDSTDDEVAA
jgi:hypothetical protein